MNDGDGTLERFGGIECVIFFEDIDKGMLPLADIVHTGR
jgi:hypothetical protein